MFVSCVPIAKKNVLFSAAIDPTARPTAEERQPVKTSTFACEMRRLASLEPIAGWLALSPLTISNLMRLFVFSKTAIAASRPVCCD